ncbi:MAG: poly(R)-hydroxyalkanoic acid synthase subunit PhaE [Steroidobacteraceae bacterium]
MAADLNTLPWMNAWLGGPGAAERLQAFGGDYAAMAASYLRSVGSPLGLDAVRGEVIEQYRRLFAPDSGLAGTATDARCQAALRRAGELAAAIAIDAFQRLSGAIANPDPAAPEVTSLRQLFELWVSCGEAAYAAAAHREDFADAQAELLASLVELRSGQAG